MQFYTISTLHDSLFWSFAGSVASRGVHTNKSKKCFQPFAHGNIRISPEKAVNKWKMHQCRNALINCLVHFHSGKLWQCQWTDDMSSLSNAFKMPLCWNRSSEHNWVFQSGVTSPGAPRASLAAPVLFFVEPVASAKARSWPSLSSNLNTLYLFVLNKKFPKEKRAKIIGIFESEVVCGSPPSGKSFNDMIGSRKLNAIIIQEY